MSAKSRTFSSELLAPVAQEAWKAIFEFAKSRKPPSCEGANIATQLHLIAGALKPQPLYQLPPETQELCFLILQDLFSICTWESSSSQHGLKQATPQYLYDTLVRNFQSQSSQAGMVHSIGKFLSQEPRLIKPYQRRLEILSSKLNQINQNSADQTTAFQHLKPRDEDVYPDHVNRYVVDVLKVHSICHPASHAAKSQDMKWHHTRICLSNGVLANKQLAQIEVIIAAKGMTYWQEISLCVSQKFKPTGYRHLKDDSVYRNHDPSENSSDLDDEGDRNGELVRMAQGTVCRMVEEPSYNRIRLQLDKNCRLHKYLDPEVPYHSTSPGYGKSLSYILSNGNFGVEHKIALAYAIARAYWQFYNSDLMHARWTSDDIWFMPIESQSKSQSRNQIPLRAFLSLPFDQHNPSLAEYLEIGDYTHRYPRILFLGIILLEIGLGEPLGLEPFESSNLSLVAHTNKAHFKAKMRLHEFKKMSWADFSYKDVFVEAIESCLDCRNFKDMRKAPRKRQKRDQVESEQPPIAAMPILMERRDVLYRRVVAPLRWLANVGFEASGEVQLITVQRVEQHKSTLVEDEECRDFWNEVKKPTFDTTNSATQSGSWMDRLKVIYSYVLRRRIVAKVTSPIRVAILDTGCNREIPFFQTPIIAKCFQEWRDFAANSQTSVDMFGHGTFMARLLLQVAPIVDLYVARVAVTPDQLESNEDEIIQAIEYAGLTWKVDVISMSFSFPKPSRAISDAIERVRKERGKSIIFLASAGNSSSDRAEAYPASHPHVISIYATDAQGTFLKSNPTRSGDGPRVLGTYGDNIPDSIIDEMIKFFPNGDFSPGTSVATAIAAGISATMLSYSATLPVQIQAEELKTAKGMTNMLRGMSQNTDHRGDFVNPIRFWSEKSKDDKVFLAICKAIADVNIAEDP